MFQNKWDSDDWNNLEEAWICRQLNNVEEFEHVLSNLLLRMTYEEDAPTIKRACSLIRKMRLWKETGLRVKHDSNGIECILLS